MLNLNLNLLNLLYSLFLLNYQLVSSNKEQQSLFYAMHLIQGVKNLVIFTQAVGRYTTPYMPTFSCINMVL